MVDAAGCTTHFADLVVAAVFDKECDSTVGDVKLGG